MALCRVILCSVCNNDKEVWFSANWRTPTICHDCTKAIALEKENKEIESLLIELRALPFEQRLERIEIWIFKHSKVNHSEDISNMLFG